MWALKGIAWGFNFLGKNGLLMALMHSCLKDAACMVHFELSWYTLRCARLNAFVKFYLAEPHHMIAKIIVWAICVVAFQLIMC